MDSCDALKVSIPTTRVAEVDQLMLGKPVRLDVNLCILNRNFGSEKRKYPKREVILVTVDGGTAPENDRVQRRLHLRVTDCSIPSAPCCSGCSLDVPFPLLSDGEEASSSKQDLHAEHSCSRTRSSSFTCRANWEN